MTIMAKIKLTDEQERRIKSAEQFLKTQDWQPYNKKKNIRDVEDGKNLRWAVISGRHEKTPETLEFITFVDDEFGAEAILTHGVFFRSLILDTDSGEVVKEIHKPVRPTIKDILPEDFKAT